MTRDRVKPKSIEMDERLGGKNVGGVKDGHLSYFVQYINRNIIFYES